MMPNEIGIKPPPTPCIARAMIMTVIEVARAASTEPITNAISTATSTFFLPSMSATRPRIGVHTDAESRYAVSTQVTVFSVVCSFVSSSGSTGDTIDWSTEYPSVPSARMTKVS
jgi:hypothetical protein